MGERLLFSCELLLVLDALLLLRAWQLSFSLVQLLIFLECMSLEVSHVVVHINEVLSDVLLHFVHEFVHGSRKVNMALSDSLFLQLVFAFDMQEETLEDCIIEDELVKNGFMEVSRREFVGVTLIDNTGH